MALGRRFTHSGSYQQKLDTDGLVLLLQRLARHRGFDRELIGSPMLKKLLPARGSTPDVQLHTVIKGRVEGAKLDATTLAHLLKSVEAELDIVHSQRF